MRILIEGQTPQPQRATSPLRREVTPTKPVAVAVERKLVYLAAPYTHPDKAVQQARFHAINKVAAYLMNELGLFVFSPISHSHPIAEDGDIPTTWEFWKPYDEAILQSCGRMVVLMLPGWEDSKGVSAEREIAQKMGIDIAYLKPEAVLKETILNCVFADLRNPALN